MSWDLEDDILDMASIELEQKLAEVIRNNPSSATRFLSIIAANMAGFEKAVRNEREVVAMNAISYILDPKSPVLRDIPMSIDAMFYRFPRGLTNPYGFSPKDIACFNAFKTAAREYFRHEGNVRWLGSAKGMEYVAWASEYICKPDPGEVVTHTTS